MKKIKNKKRLCLRKGECCVCLCMRECACVLCVVEVAVTVQDSWRSRFRAGVHDIAGYKLADDDMETERVG